MALPLPLPASDPEPVAGAEPEPDPEPVVGAEPDPDPVTAEDPDPVAGLSAAFLQPRSATARAMLTDARRIPRVYPGGGSRRNSNAS